MANDAFPDRLDHWIRACVDVLNRAPDFTAYRDRVASLVDLYRKDWEATGTPPETSSTTPTLRFDRSTRSSESTPRRYCGPA